MDEEDEHDTRGFAPSAKVTESRVLEVATSMLRKRGLEIVKVFSDLSAYDLTIPAIRAVVPESPTPGTSAYAHRAREPPGSEVLLFLFSEPKLRVVSIRELKESLGKPRFSRVKRVILVSKAAITYSAREEFNGLDITTELFLYAQLAFDVTTHMHVPRHWIIDPSEDEDYRRMRDYYRVTDPRRTLYLQLSSDPVSQFHGLQPGDIIKYQRCTNGQTAELVFRYVCE